MPGAPFIPRAERVAATRINGVPVAWAGVRCSCVDLGCRLPMRGPGCPHYDGHCRKHIAHADGVAGAGKTASEGGNSA